MATESDTKHDEQQEAHPRWMLDEIIHQPVRLSIVAVLAQNKKVDFTFLKDYLQLTDSNLSRHLTALEEVGYIEINKVFEGKRPRTWLTLSAKGQEAFNKYVQALNQIVGQAPTKE
jgi:DNA-binding MarR family transcriptional regulator